MQIIKSLKMCDESNVVWIAVCEELLHELSILSDDRIVYIPVCSVYYLFLNSILLFVFLCVLLYEFHYKYK